MFGKTTLPLRGLALGRARKPDQRDALVHGHELVRLAGAGHRVLTPGIAPGQPVLAGRVALQTLRPGLAVHSADASDLRDMITHSVEAPGLRVLLLLDGCVDVSFGHCRISLSARASGRAPRPRGLLINLRQPERFERRWQHGAHERKVAVIAGSDWLAGNMAPAGSAQSSAHQAFLNRHLAVAEWQPSPRAIALAGQMVQAPAAAPLLQRLFLESRAIELLGEALASLDREQPGRTALSPREYQRAQALRDFLDSDACGSPSLAGLSERAGVNANTLQRQFRAAFGTTIFDYLREQRLQRARVALEAHGSSVAEAARLACYTSPANFATAFKRRFGISPKAARGRV